MRLDEVSLGSTSFTMFSLLLTHDRQMDIARLKQAGIVNHS
jgi:hypothetical protein